MDNTYIFSMQEYLEEIKSDLQAHYKFKYELCYNEVSPFVIIEGLIDNPSYLSAWFFNKSPLIFWAKTSGICFSGIVIL